jgi:glutathione S-transferase
MKLYYAPQASFAGAAHCVARTEAALRTDPRRQPQQAHGQRRRLPGNQSQGYVAALQLDNGAVLTEGPVILQYLADLQPQSGAGARQFRTAAFAGVAEFHFERDPRRAWCAVRWAAAGRVIKEKLFKRFAVLVAVLEQQEYLLPSGFSVADALLFVVLRWAGLFGIELAQWPALARFQARIEQRPTVVAALAAEAA